MANLHSNIWIVYTECSLLPVSQQNAEHTTSLEVAFLFIPVPWTFVWKCTFGIFALQIKKLLCKISNLGSKSEEESHIIFQGQEVPEAILASLEKWSLKPKTSARSSYFCYAATLPFWQSCAQRQTGPKIPTMTPGGSPFRKAQRGKSMLVPILFSWTGTVSLGTANLYSHSTHIY